MNQAHIVKRKRGPIEKEEWSIIYARETWLHDWRDARITRGHSGSKADAILQNRMVESRGCRRLQVKGRFDWLARRNTNSIGGFMRLLICYPPAKKAEEVRAFRCRRMPIHAPNLPEWY